MQQFDHFTESTVSILNVELEETKFFTIKAGESHQYGGWRWDWLVKPHACGIFMYQMFWLACKWYLWNPCRLAWQQNKNRSYALRTATPKNGIAHYMVNSPKFMEYENKTSSAQPKVPLSASQRMITIGVCNTSSSPIATQAPNPLILNNIQPIVSHPRSNQCFSSSVPSRSMPNLDSTNAEYPTAVTIAPTVSTGHNDPLLLRTRALSNLQRKTSDRMHRDTTLHLALSSNWSHQIRHLYPLC